jgi:hypothetical protein
LSSWERKSDKSDTEDDNLRRQLQAVTAELNEYKRKVRLLDASGAVLRDRPVQGAGKGV